MGEDGQASTLVAGEEGQQQSWRARAKEVIEARALGGRALLNYVVHSVATAGVASEVDGPCAPYCTHLQTAVCMQHFNLCGHVQALLFVAAYVVSCARDLWESGVDLCRQLDESVLGARVLGGIRQSAGSDADMDAR